jgi:glycosyltransferase 2 family protein
MKKSHLKNLFKILLVVGLFYLLGKKGFLSFSETHRALVQWHLTVPALLIFFACTLLGMLRWQLLLRAQGIHLPWSRTAQLVMVGNFFNIALPGAVTGDFVKAFYIGREIEGKRARAFGSILFDRVAGLSALILLSATAFAVGVESYPAIKAFVITAAAIVIGFYAYLFLVREHHDPLLIALRKIELKVPKAGSFTRVYEGLREYHNHRITVLQVLVVSIIIHMLIGVACRNIAYALGEHELSLVALYVVIPLGLLVTAVPVAPAGVGTGHAAFAFLFPLIGSSQGANVYTFYALQAIIIGGIGGLVYLQFRSHEPSPDFSTAQS